METELGSPVVATPAVAVHEYPDVLVGMRTDHLLAHFPKKESLFGLQDRGVFCSTRDCKSCSTKALERLDPRDEGFEVLNC